MADRQYILLMEVTNLNWFRTANLIPKPINQPPKHKIIKPRIIPISLIL